MNFYGVRNEDKIFPTAVVDENKKKVLNYNYYVGFDMPLYILNYLHKSGLINEYELNDNATLNRKIYVVKNMKKDFYDSIENTKHVNTTLGDLAVLKELNKITMADAKEYAKRHVDFTNITDYYEAYKMNIITEEEALLNIQSKIKINKNNLNNLNINDLATLCEMKLIDKKSLIKKTKVKNIEINDLEDAVGYHRLGIISTTELLNQSLSTITEMTRYEYSGKNFTLKI